MKSILAVLALVFSVVSWGTEEVYNLRKQVGYTPTVFEIEDGRYYELGLSPDFVDAKTTLHVTLGVDEKEIYGYVDTYEELKVQLEVTPLDNFNNPLTILPTEILEISYTAGASYDIHASTFVHSNNIHKYQIEAVVITPGFESIPVNVYLEARLIIDRYYEIQTTAPAIGAFYVNYNTLGERVKTATTFIPDANFDNGQELEIHWDYVQGAEEYELEWTWIDNYGSSGLASIIEDFEMDLTERDFELNNTRVLTKDQHYTIPLIYNKGFLVYRVRGVGRWIDDDFADIDKPKHGQWTATGPGLTKVSHWPNYVTITTPHEALKNWQFQSVYAEDGKKKEIVSYFDGSLRNRQTVTKINSNDEAIVGENIYDNQGRSAIQILPTPVNNPALKYYPQLNRIYATDGEGEELSLSSLKPATHSDFDWDDLTIDECNAVSLELSERSGAAKYYSPNNSVENNWQDFVPLAERYPYVQVEYTADNTGRIRGQSGVGSDYKMDGSHITRYYYSQADQTELNRLFGYQVGRDSRYKKNIVVDANGQVSISYIDPQGRVIATALAGDNSTNLMSLADETDVSLHAETIKDVLSKLTPTDPDTPSDDNQLFISGNNGASQDGLEASRVLVPVADDNIHTFTYSIQTASFLPCPSDATEIYPFAYDLNIDLRNECGTPLIPDDHPNVGDDGILRDEIDAVDYSSIYTWTSNLDIESNQLAKRLVVDADKLEEYAMHYIENSACILPLVIDDNTDCDEILDDFPDYEFPSNGLSCTIAELNMIQDVSPGGQYGATDGSDPLSVFSPLNALNKGFVTNPETDELYQYSYKFPLANYEDETEAVSYVETIYDPILEIFTPFVDSRIFDEFVEGEDYDSELIYLGDNVYKVKPQYLELPDFLANWNSSWAEVLVLFHPELDYLTHFEQYCEGVTVPGSPATGLSSNSYDATLNQIFSYESVQNDVGFENPFNTNISGELPGDWILENDPFYHMTIDDLGAPYTAISDATALKNAYLEDILSNYKRMDVPLTLWEYSIKVAYCGADLAGACTATFASLSPEQKTQAWIIYKSGYLAEKYKIMQVFSDYYGISQGCYNGYIGDYPERGPAISGFLAYEEYILSGLLPPPGGAYTAAAGNILDIYAKAYEEKLVIADPLEDEDFFTYWSSAGASYGLFEEKQRRFIPIDNLYNATIPELESIHELEAEVDHDSYLETGRCAISFDVEYFLNALVQRGIMAATLTTLDTDASLVPEFTLDLYTALGGTVADPGAPVELTTSIASGVFKVTANDAAAMATMGNIELTLPGAVTWDFSNITKLSTLFYVDGASNFEILAEVTEGAVVSEHVITGTTTIDIDDCDKDLSQPCDRPEKLAGALFNAFRELLEDPSITLAKDFATSWYGSSEIAILLDDEAEDPDVLVSTVAHNFIGLSKHITFANLDGQNVEATFDALPPLTEIEALTGFTIDESSPSELKIHIYYIEALTAEIKEVIATIDYRFVTDDPIDLSCDCSDDDELEGLLLDMLNEAIAIDNAGGDFSESFEEYTDLSEYLELDADLLYTFEIDHPVESRFRLKFQLSADDCLFRLDAVDDVPLFASLLYLTELNVIVDDAGNLIYISCKGMFSDLVIREMTLDWETPPCTTIPGCVECVPAPIQPISCSDAFLDYKSEMLILKGLTEAEYLESEYGVEEFCEGNFAYVTTAYLSYLSTMGITTAIIAEDSEYFISIGQFMATAMGPGVGLPDGMMADAIAEYDTYTGTLSPGEIAMSWNLYISSVYLLDKTICPPLLPADLNIEYDYPCEQFTANVDTMNAKQEYRIYLENMKEEFKDNYIQQAMSSVVENFTYSSLDKEFHYTLYYYDQAGNLIQTVPPKGTDRIIADNATINAERVAEKDLADDTEVFNTAATVLPVHTLQTQYQYNSLNQLVWQSTPDGGESNFAYDRLGRLILSQNALQFENDQMSYTIYDDLGRIREVGEMTINDDVHSLEKGKLVGVSEIEELAYNFPATIAIGDREEVTTTIYDELIGADPSDFEDYSADNTRNRITGVMYFENYSGGFDFDNATFYDYDVHGNVKELIQDIKDDDLATILGSDSEIKKKTKYDYDLVSGNVKEVVYQSGEKDQFIHDYVYDADNRITNVFTSEDRVHWEQDAKYFYYDHGPLARVEIGDQKVQSLDYAYTIQGWLKGVNSETLAANDDQGKDSKIDGINEMNGRDVMGYSLNYYQDDYKARHGADFLSLSEGVLAHDHDQDLFNGNIKEMFTASTNTLEEYIGTSHTWYNYDQLNRIRSMNQEHLYEEDTPTDRYAATYTYDANGNLETLTRKSWGDPGDIGTFGLTNIDNFTYHYTNGTNQLEYVEDPLGAVLGSDLADQTPFNVLADVTYDYDSNYGYDEIGQLVQDRQEEIQNIEWKVTGKVKRINRTAASSKNELEFTYDAMGNRIIKAVYDNATDELLSKTYYSRDAQGNVMSIYTLKINDPSGDPDEDNLYLSERNIYGSSRVGLESVDKKIGSSSIFGEIVSPVYDQTIGDKRYELSNHLGNVLEVITDRKLAIDDGSGGVDYYIADVVSQSDYYPFGMLMPNRNDPGTNDYRYAFNGMEKDDEVAGNGNSYDYGARLYNPRTGRWFSRDPLAGKQPNWSPYKAFKDNPIIFDDPDGETEYLRITINNKQTGETMVVTAPVSNELYASHIYENGMVHYSDFMREKTITIQEDGSIIAGETSGIITGEERASVFAAVPFRGGVAKWIAYGDDDLEGEGGTQPGGEHLVTKDGGASATKQKASNDVKTRDISDLMLALGAIKGGKLPNTYAEKLRKYISNVKKLNKVLDNPMNVPKPTDNNMASGWDHYGGAPMTIEYIKQEKDVDSEKSNPVTIGTVSSSTGDVNNPQPGDIITTILEDNEEIITKRDSVHEERNMGGDYIRSGTIKSEKK